MFSNVGWGEILVIVIAALIIIGPERLPEFARQAKSAFRDLRTMLAGAQASLKEDLGDDYEQIAKPIQQISQLRGMTPRALITQHLFDGDDQLFSLDDTNTTRPAGAPAGPTAANYQQSPANPYAQQAQAVQNYQQQNYPQQAAQPAQQPYQQQGPAYTYGQAPAPVQPQAPAPAQQPYQQPGPVPQAPQQAQYEPPAPGTYNDVS